MTGVFLGVRFFRRNVAASLSAVLSLAACIVPVLVIWGLKSGYVDGLLALLRSDPINLELRIRGDRPLGEAELASIRDIDGIGYLEPTTRGLSLRVFVIGEDGKGRQDASLVPSTAGDPLLEGGPPPGDGEAVLSAALARRLPVATGARIEIVTVRSDGGDLFRRAVVVARILPAARLSGNRMLVHPRLILGVEDFVDGLALPDFGLAGKPRTSEVRTYANARIYATDLEHVDDVGRALEALGYHVDLEASAVDLVLALDRAAAILVTLFGAALLLGGAVSLWSSLSLSFLPQRRHLALLLLMGGTRYDVAAYVLVQASTIGAAAIVASVAGYAGIAALINPLFAASLGGIGAVCHLDPSQLAAAAAICAGSIAGIAFGFVVSCWSIQATGALRDES